MTHDWLDSDELYAVNLFPDLSLTEGDGGCQSLLVSLGSSQSLRLSTSSLDGGRRWTRTLLQLIFFFFTFSQVYFKTLSQLWWLGGEIPSRRRAKSLVQGLRAISKCSACSLINRQMGWQDVVLFCCYSQTSRSRICCKKQTNLDITETLI